MERTRIFFIHSLLLRSVAKTLMLVLLTVPVILSACGAKMQSDHMLYQNPKPPILINKNQAVLVIVRTTPWGSGYLINFYIDGKFIGQTKGKSYFITSVAPGTRYLVADIWEGNMDKVRINFDAGRVYFINQLLYYAYPKARIGFNPMTVEEAMKAINDSECEYRIYDVKNPGWDMSEEYFEKTKTEYEKDVKELPSRYEDILKYRGYGKL